MRPCLLVLLFALASPLAAVDPGLIDLAGPDANFILGVRVSAIAESPIIKDALAEAQGAESGKGGILGALGDNPLEGLEEILLLGHMDPGQDGEEMNGLLLARGDFEDERLQKAFCAESCKEESYSGLKLFHGSHDGEPATFVKLSSHYAAAGKAEQVKALLQRRATGQKPQLATALNDWVRGLDKHHIWLAAKGPFEAPPADGGGPPIGQIAEKLKGFGLGITLGDEVHFGLQVEADSEEGAQELHMMTQGLLMMFSAADASEDGKPSETAALLESLKLRREGGHVFADLRIPAKELENTIRSGLSDAGEEADAAASFGGPAPAEAQSAPVRPAKPRSKGPIRIYGLGDEPVEVGSTPR